MRNESRRSSPRKTVIPDWLGFVVPALFGGLRLIVWVFCRLDYARALRLAELLSPVFGAVTRRRRRRNFEHVLVGGEWTAARYRQLDRAHIRYVARLGVEFSRLFVTTPAELIGRVELRGLEHLRAAQAQGRGVLLIGGHTGSWWFVPSVLGAAGENVTAVFTSMSQAAIRDYMVGLAGRFRVRLAFVNQGASVRAKEVFHENGILYAAFDITPRKDHPRWLPFGPAVIPIDLGAALLAQRYRVPVLLVSCRQLADGRSRIELLPDTSPGPAVGAGSAEEITRRWLGFLHRQILAFPEQWWLWTEQELRSGSGSGREASAHEVRRTPEPSDAAAGPR